jgi:sugar phosphate permease
MDSAGGQTFGLYFLARLAPWLGAALLFALGFAFGVPAMLAGAALAGLGVLYGIERFVAGMIEAIHEKC